MTRILLIIGAGGFLGTIFRHLFSQFVQNRFLSAFPFGTMAVNILGCFLIGLIYAFSEKGNLLTAEWRLFLTTGLCGGFTTFSTFSYESIYLIRDGQFFFLSLNVAISVIAGFAATYFGITLVNFL